MHSTSGEVERVKAIKVKLRKCIKECLTPFFLGLNLMAVPQERWNE